MVPLMFIPLALIGLAPTPAAGDANSIKRAALERLDEGRAAVDELASQLWTFAETSLEETKSSALLADRLQAAGFSIERGVAKLPTAFVASYGSGHPVIGILAEFDALPGVGNDPVPMRRTRSDGVTAGHGCGHNLFGAASVSGAIAIKEAMAANRLKGTLKVFGSPAEETLYGKVVMAKAGVFKGLDAAIDWHPRTRNRVANAVSRAMNNFEVEFFGQAAHAAADPWNGRSALDAVELMNHAVNMMREHIGSAARIHYVIVKGGEAPNVVPEYAKVWYFVRDQTRADVARHYDRILDIARGAALATATTHKVRLVTGVHSYLFNRPLQEAILANMKIIGPPKFDAEDQRFGKALQKAAGKPANGFVDGIDPLADQPEPPDSGSTDAAEVSRIAPTGAFNVATAPDGIPWHSWAATASHGTAAGRKGALVAAKIIAATGIDLLTDATLRQQAADFFKKATGGKPYVSPIK